MRSARSDISLHRRMEVTPLAVIWGGAQRNFETVDVPRHVIPGGQLSTWLRSLQGEVLDKAAARRL